MVGRLPYVGVSGVMKRSEVESALALFERAFPSDDRLLMVGVLASSKTLCGHPNKYPRRYPAVGDIAGIFTDHPRALNLVHVAHDQAWRSSVDGSCIPLLIDMFRAMEAGGPHCHGIQVNCLRLTGRKWRKLVEWASAFKLFTDRYPSKRVVLQLGHVDIAAPLPIDALKSLAPHITDIVIDASGGCGVPIDPGRAQWAIRELRAAFGSGVGIGIAGGLCAATLPNVALLLQERSWLSIDAEGRLRDDADGGGDLVFDKVKRYIIQAARVFGGLT